MEYQFKVWLQTCHCFVTRQVLSRLIDEYLKGNKDALFGKMDQLIEHELFELVIANKNIFIISPQLY